MKSLSTNEYSDGKLPVFVFPTDLNFYVDDQSTHKQVLTLYNPYDFMLKFKVLCNNPGRYNVVESEGLIKQKCCIDIVIRAINITPHNVSRDDKFRIQLYEHGLTSLLGKKDVPALLLSSKTEDTMLTRQRSQRPSSREMNEMYTSQRRESVVLQRSLPSIPVIIVSLLCVIALMLPTQGEATSIYSRIPDYLHLTVNQKLIAAYVLGLITMAILKT